MRCPLLLVICLLTLPGCGPRLEAARDQVLAQIDSLLGEIDVKRREISPAVKQAEATLAAMKRSRVEVQVRAAQVANDLASASDRLAQTDKALSRLRGLLAEDRPVEIAGTPHSPGQLRGMAARIIATRRTLAAQAETLRSTHERLASIVALLLAKEQDGRDRLDALKGLLVEIDAKALGVKAIQEAALACEDAEGLDFEALEKQVRDLGARIDGELRFHEETLKQSVAESRSVGSILRDTGTNGEVVAEIDKLLGSR